jgi:hypothetical protein
MTGLIWIIQLVHYPSFHYVDRENYKTFAAFHTQTITYVVMPVMALEILSQLVLLLRSQDAVNISATALLSVIWLATIFYSIPCHNLLANGYDTQVVDKLVQTNWIRTVAWTLKSLVLLYPYYLEAVDK